MAAEGARFQAGTSVDEENANPRWAEKLAGGAGEGGYAELMEVAR